MPPGLAKGLKKKKTVKQLRKQIARWKRSKFPGKTPKTKSGMLAYIDKHNIPAHSL